MSYLENIVVSYGETPTSEPADAIRTIDANNDDINASFKGKYVWLSARYGSGSSNKVSGIDIIIQADKDDRYDDLAKGAGGDYRYLNLRKDGSKKIVNVALLRRKESVSFETVHQLGYDGYSTDINKGRGGDYLYLVWKSD
ncbi:hypothetical protein Asppvi_003474 [Aspergillus pseudoviridinutans]|uniref:Uncharacterized protein n=1 Tax=Aspergillus pseudoviridinutans TaxID=1517512 RepID=A0A9P3ETE4_9EURO|nr:uncharacterized protein Asppvi_003474 [Aspergillus pseudoviridinutans]GIJ84625.1 hypothetical protein Asppvi_003474 [Aspergillus pseudoviridinutans]